MKSALRFVCKALVFISLCYFMTCSYQGFPYVAVGIRGTWKMRKYLMQGFLLSAFCFLFIRMQDLIILASEF